MLALAFRAGCGKPNRTPACHEGDFATKGRDFLRSHGIHQTVPIHHTYHFHHINLIIAILFGFY